MPRGKYRWGTHRDLALNHLFYTCGDCGLSETQCQVVTVNRGLVNEADEKKRCRKCSSYFQRHRLEFAVRILLDE